jgi:Ca2+-binding RTX toxin-like protein
VVTALPLGNGAALAAGDYCTGDPCYGTSGADVLLGTPHSETIEVLGGNDFVDALEGRDTVYGGRGNDRIDLVDGYKDVVDCGRGRADTVYYDLVLDTVRSCEDKRPDIPIIK